MPFLEFTPCADHGLQPCQDPLSVRHPLTERRTYKNHPARQHREIRGFTQYRWLGGERNRDQRGRRGGQPWRWRQAPVLHRGKISIKVTVYRGSKGNRWPLDMYRGAITSPGGETVMVLRPASLGS